jgi:hypothetical protein
MRIADGYLLREIAGSWVVVPLGARLVQLNGLISLNESGALLWKRLEKGADKNELIQLITEVYDVTRTEAAADVDEFLVMLEMKELLV